MFSRMGSAAFKKDLTNIKRLSEYLGHPHKKFKSIHVGGTNGKGSVSHMLAAVFQKAGYKTGLYTSPHLYDFRERIRINGEMVSEEFVVAFVDRMKPLIEEIEPSFFEITVAMAFEAFVENKVDIAIIEVGLGGRLDSTNIITPELSVITNIGWDHMNMLGNSLEEIAFEKAGIIKQKVPVVIGETLSETKAVFEQAARDVASQVVFAEEIYQVKRTKLQSDNLQIDYADNEGKTTQIETDLKGIYQVKNVKTVLAAIRSIQLLGFSIDDQAVKEGLRNVRKHTGLMGRWEILQSNPTVVLDVAHNKNGIETVLEHLETLHDGQLHLIIGMVKDKEISQVLSMLPKQATYYFTEAHIPRALPANELLQKAEEMNLSGDIYPDVNDALATAMQKANADDLILVCGSIFLVAEVKREQFSS